MFRGVYHGKKVHEDDLADVLDRAVQAGCQKLMVTGSDLKESAHAVEIARDHRQFNLYNARVHGSSASDC